MMPLPFDPFDPPIISLPKLLWRPFLLSTKEASFAKRKFVASDDNRRRHLERVGEAFIGGYNRGLLADEVAEVRTAIEDIDPFFRGFVAEGSAMGVAVHDGLSWRKPLLPALLIELQRDYIYLAYVGCGWAMARMPWRSRRILAALDPLLQWLAYDGLGFHDTYFKPERISSFWRRIDAGYGSRAYDQGVGRALWFTCGASVPHASHAIGRFPAERQADLWSGLGLAMSYAGACDASDLRQVVGEAAGFSGEFGQGTAFGCEARARSGFVPAATEHAATAVLGTPVAEVAARVRQAREGLDPVPVECPGYEIWRARLRETFQMRCREAAE